VTIVTTALLATAPSRPAFAPCSLDELRQRGAEAVNEGRYEEALLLYDEALETARRLDDADAVDLFLVNRAAVQIELVEEDDPTLAEEQSTLRAILGRSGNAETGWLASYQLGRLHERRRDFKKALFYARMARDRAGWTDVPRWRSSSCNLLGNVLLAESLVGEALDAYRDALATLPCEEGTRRARISANVGYCWLLQDRVREGMAQIFAGLRFLRRQRLDRFSIAPHVDLAYGHLLLERFHHARRHAARALALSTTYGDREARKNALFLLGEAQAKSGRLDEARATFQSLQRDFFPGNTALVGQLLAVDVMPMLNLRA
jgi:tetratricopeptide (TPR) repeat protein